MNSERNSFDIIKEQEEIIANLRKNLDDAIKKRDSEIEKVENYCKIHNTELQREDLGYRVRFIKAKTRTEWDEIKLKELLPDNLRGSIFEIKEVFNSKNANALLKSGAISQEIFQITAKLIKGEDYYKFEKMEKG